MLILTFMLPVYIIIGCFIETAGMLAITVPIFTPVAEVLQFDLIWFGIIVIKMCEVALVTPPMGANVFVVSNVAKVPSLDVFRGVGGLFLPMSAPLSY